MWLTDPKTGKKSATLTLLMMTAFVSLLKISVSGVIIADITLGTFSGADFATMIGSVGGLYGFRKYTDKEKE